MISRVSCKNKGKQAKRKNGVKKDQTKKDGTKKQKTASPGVERGLSTRASNSLTLHHSDTHDLKN